MSLVEKVFKIVSGAPESTQGDQFAVLAQGCAARLKSEIEALDKVFKAVICGSVPFALELQDGAPPEIGVSLVAARIADKTSLAFFNFYADRDLIEIVPASPQVASLLTLPERRAFTYARFDVFLESVAGITLAEKRLENPQIDAYLARVQKSGVPQSYQAGYQGVNLANIAGLEQGQP